MVDSIKGPGGITIIKTKPKPKVGSSSKDAKFEKTLNEKISDSESATIEKSHISPMQHNIKLAQQQQLSRMNYVQELASQIKNGTYKMASPEALAEKIFLVLSDPRIREKFIKKLINEEKEKLGVPGKGNMTELELKKLVFLIKEAHEEAFNDPELEQLIAEFC